MDHQVRAALIFVGILAGTPAAAQPLDACSFLFSTSMGVQQQMEEVRRCLQQMNEKLRSAQSTIEMLCSTVMLHETEINLLNTELRALAKSLDQPDPSLERSEGARYCDPASLHAPSRRRR